MSGRAKRRERKANTRIVRDMHFDLRSPCDDCPFRSDAPFHEGIAAELYEVMTKFRDGQLAHTCHKTDPRADCAPEKRAPAGSPIQHCAGALIMAINADSWQSLMTRAVIKKRFDPARLNMKAPVFKSIPEMIVHYAPGIAKMFPNHANSKALLQVVDQLKERGIVQ